MKDAEMMDIDYFENKHAESDEVRATADEIVKALEDVGAKLVCIDFDATFISIHTRGMWESTAHDLCSHVRPMFLDLIPLVAIAGMHVALVTFSPQVQLIREVLYLCFPAEVADNILIRGDDESWTVTRGNFTSFALDNVGDIYLDATHKLPYIVSAAIDAGMRNDTCIRNYETVLIDDDPENIHLANRYGIGAIRFCPEGSDVKALCESIKSLQVSECTITTPSKTPQRKANPRHSEENVLDTPIAKKSDSDDQADWSCGNRKKFQFFTPSPVMKLKCDQPVRRPRLKRQSKLRCSRNIDETLEDYLEITLTEQHYQGK